MGNILQTFLILIVVASQYCVSMITFSFSITLIFYEDDIFNIIANFVILVVIIEIDNYVGDFAHIYFISRPGSPAPLE